MPVQKNFGIVADIRGYVQVTKGVKYDVCELVQKSQFIVDQLVPYVTTIWGSSFRINREVWRTHDSSFSIADYVNQAAYKELHVEYEIKALARKILDVNFSVSKEVIKKPITMIPMGC